MMILPRMLVPTPLGCASRRRSMIGGRTRRRTGRQKQEGALAANLMPMSAGRSESERLVSADSAEDDKSFELKLRPKWLREFIGQEKAKEQLAIALTAAKS